MTPEQQLSNASLLVKIRPIIGGSLEQFQLGITTSKRKQPYIIAKKLKEQLQYIATLVKRFARTPERNTNRSSKWFHFDCIYDFFQKRRIFGEPGNIILAVLNLYSLFR